MMLFSDIEGQNEIKQSLKKSINDSSVSHCYIFEGPNNMGKYDLALVFAQSLLCKNFVNDPCNECNDCIKVNTMNHPDLHVVNNDEKTIKREDIDNLIESINIKPYESNKKVYIINNCQDMTPQAANTFLKTLEEPPKDTIIILLTNNINLLLPTIISRCQVIKFKYVDKNEIVKILIDKYNIDEEKASIVAYYSKGILNKAKNIAIEKDDLFIMRSDIINVFDKIIKSDSYIIFECENYFEEKKVNIDIIIEIMMIWIRDVSFVRNNIENLVINKDYLSLANIHAGGMKTDDVDELIQYLQSVSENIKNNVNYKLAVDKMVFKIQEVFKI
ncbi:MAG: DNA polymerase III subunit delta' [Tissierellia bacterium]|nr:DNA polymerase III subunit delta' [Tissierellia bacterium]